MISRNSIDWLRDLDTRWQRSRGPDRRRILVNSRTPMNYATVRPIVEGLQNDPRVEAFFTATETPLQLSEVYTEARGPYQLIGPKAAAFMHFDSYLTADSLWVRLPRGTRRVQTFHGVAGKNRTVYDSPAQSMRGWHRLFFINKLRLQHFIQADAIDADSPAIRLIGMPRVDCLVDGSLERNEVLTSLGIDPSRRTVLYAPTWSKYSSLPLMGEQLVKRLGAAGYAVIVKLHDRSRQRDDYYSGGDDWGERLMPLLRDYGGVLATGSNSSPYLVGADVLITDHSSVGFEYLLLDRPLIRIHVPQLLEKTDIEPVYVQLMSEAATSVADIAQAVAAVDHNFADPQRKSQSRKAVAQEMFYEPGTATQRAIAEMYDVLELSPPEDVGKIPSLTKAETLKTPKVADASSYSRDQTTRDSLQARGTRLMNEEVDISVVVTTHNRCSLLAEALKSLLNQEAGGPGYEVITVDNNSTDETRQTIQSFIDRGHSNLRYVFEPRQGISYGRNAGIAQANAPIIAFTDDDVRVAPNWVSNIKRAFDEHAEVDFVGGKILPQWPQEPPSWLTRDHWWPLALLDGGESAFYVNAANPMVLPTANASFRKSVFSRVGVFLPEFSGREDHELILRLWLTGRQGLYQPTIVVTADVQPVRMTKSYHHRWNYLTGKYNSMMRLDDMMGPDGGLKEKPMTGPTIFGVPAYFYRQLISEGLYWCKAISQESKRLQHENQICYLIGYITKRIEQNSKSQSQ